MASSEEHGVLRSSTGTDQLPATSDTAVASSLPKMKGVRQPVQAAVSENSEILAESGWDKVQCTYWTNIMARRYVKMCHIDKLFPRAVWEQNHKFSGVKPRESTSAHFTHRAFEVWNALYPTKPFGVQNKNIISYSLAAMLYAELVLKKKMDWRTAFTRKKNDRTEYVNRDVPDMYGVVSDDTNNEDEDMVPEGGNVEEADLEMDAENPLEAIGLGNQENASMEEVVPVGALDALETFTEVPMDVQIHHAPNTTTVASKVDTVRGEVQAVLENHEEHIREATELKEVIKRLQEERDASKSRESQLLVELEDEKRTRAEAEKLCVYEHENCKEHMQQISELQRELEEMRRERNDMDVDRLVDSIAVCLVDDDSNGNRSPGGARVEQQERRRGLPSLASTSQNLQESDSLSLPYFDIRNVDAVSHEPQVHATKAIIATMFPSAVEAEIQTQESNAMANVVDVPISMNVLPGNLPGEKKSSGFTEQDYLELLKFLESEYKDFDERYGASQRKVRELEAQVEDSQTQLSELKGLDEEGRLKFIKDAEIEVLREQLQAEKDRNMAIETKHMALEERLFKMEKQEASRIHDEVEKRVKNREEEDFRNHVKRGVTEIAKDIVQNKRLDEKFKLMAEEDDFNAKVAEKAMERYKDIEMKMKRSGEPSGAIMPAWLNWAFNTSAREVRLREAKRNLALQMAISSESSANIGRSFTLFETARGSETFPLPAITCWGDSSTMFERLHHSSNGSAQAVHWEYEVEEGWLPYSTTSSNLYPGASEIIHVCQMATWMESGDWCVCCFEPLGPEGAFQLGSCGHTFHVRCIQEAALHCMRCPQCQAPLPRRFYELFGILSEMPTGHEFDSWNLSLDQEPHHFLNYKFWGKKLIWDSSLKRPSLITSQEMDPMSWMTSEYEIETRARAIEDEVERELFCRGFGGHWSLQHNKFFRFPSKRITVDGIEVGGWDHGRIAGLEAQYNTNPIGRAKFLAALKNAAIVHVEAAGPSDEEDGGEEADARKAFVRRIGSTITDWRKALASAFEEKIAIDEAKVDTFVSRVEQAVRCYSRGEVDLTPTRKRKRREDEDDSDESPSLRREMRRVDEAVHMAPPRPSQRVVTRAMRAQRMLHVDENFNLVELNNISETSSSSRMVDSDSE